MYTHYIVYIVSIFTLCIHINPNPIRHRQGQGQRDRVRETGRSGLVNRFMCVEQNRACLSKHLHQEECVSMWWITSEGELHLAVRSSGEVRNPLQVHRDGHDSNPTYNPHYSLNLTTT